MADKSAIEWTDATWNPMTGCTKVSRGCDHCYAERFSERFRGVRNHPFEQGFDLTLRPDRLNQPLQWHRPRLIFVNSMSDLFHKHVPSNYIDRVFETMEAANWHIYQVLTKRSSLLRDYVNKRYPDRSVPAHIWLGVSIEDAAMLVRLAHLKKTNAQVRFVSFEPLLNSIGKVDLTGISWAIVGGESGPGARYIDPYWVRELRNQCLAQGVAFFFKQWGGRTPKAGGNELDGRQWLEYPNVGHTYRLHHGLRAAGAPTDEDGKDAAVGPWAKEKLGCLGKYLDAYTNILSKQQWLKEGYVYIDAFAGRGKYRVRTKETATQDPNQSVLDVEMPYMTDSDQAEFINGSPRVALSIKNKFTDYVFIESDSTRAEQLKELEASVAGQARVHIRQQDCNAYLKETIPKVNWKQRRGVIFIDPFGMQIPWSTLTQIAATKAIEVFINFPVGMAIQRLLRKDAKFSEEQRYKLDGYFGTPDWFDVVYETSTDMAGEITRKRRNSGKLLLNWYREQLEKAFGYVSEARLICNSHGGHLYYLIFAGPNKTGRKIANYILSQGEIVER